MQRLEPLCDPGSLEVIRSGVASRHMGEKTRAGDGVVGGAGAHRGPARVLLRAGPGYVGGSLGEAHADTIVRVIRLAGRAGAPVVGFVESGGARMQEGIAALGGYARIFREMWRCSGRVPQVSIVTGLSAGGGAYSPALTDFVVMTREASMFLTGPAVVRDALGEDVSASELGGTRVHGRNGVCHLVADGDPEAAAPRPRAPRLPAPARRHAGAPRPVRDRTARRDPGPVVPGEARAVYDVRDVARCVLDGGELLELAPGWARNIVTGFGRLDGQPVGLIANQPRHLGGVLDAASSQKGARFVQCATRSASRSWCSWTRPATCRARARRAPA